MKKLMATTLLAFVSLPVFAVDSWRFSTTESGETIYKSGFEQFLLVGKKGLGFTSIAGIVDSYGDSVILKIDDYPPEKISIRKLGNNTFLISNDEATIHKVANAKRIDLKYRITAVR